MITRRRLVTTAAAMTLAAPTFAHAQQPGRTYRIAVWSIGRPLAELAADAETPYRAFFQELARLGFVEGRNLVVQRYSGEGLVERYPEIARQIVASRPDLISPNGNVGARILKTLTTTIPIVVPTLADPIADGLVTSIARPEGNITGFTTDGGIELWTLRVQLLKEIVPAAKTFGYLVSLGVLDLTRPSIEFAANRLGLSMRYYILDGNISAASYETAFARMKADGIEGLLVSSGSENTAYYRHIIAHAARARVPAIYGWPYMAKDGGLMAYGIDVNDNYRKAAQYVARILNGTAAGWLPIQQPTHFYFIVNGKVANELGLDLPATIQARAHEIID